MAAQALWIRDAGQRQLLRIAELAIDIPIEHAELAIQDGMPI